MTRHDDISRRDLLRGRLFGGLLKHVEQSLSPAMPERGDDSAPAERPSSPRFAKSFPIHRPPGAIEEEAFLAGCTRCDACIEACPHDAIIHASDRFRRAAGTPMIDPSPAGQPCMMCADFPCIAACEPNVLRMDAVKRMATATIQPHNCLAYQKSFCTVCSEHCPVEGAIVEVDHKPSIVESICTGCGVCQHVCLAPDNAILLMPLSVRMSPLPRVEST